MPRIRATATDDARRRRPEVVRREAGHLSQIAHGGLGRIELPVGIGGKAGGGVPCQIGADVGQMLRVPHRQQTLQPLKAVGEQQAYSRETEHGKCILAPVHLLAGVDAGELVNKPFDRTKHRIQPGALAFQHASQIDAYRTNARQQNRGVKAKLQPAIDGHSEFLREKQGEDQVAQQQNGQNQPNSGGDIDLHGLPQLLASLDVEKRQGEENNGEQQHY